MGICIEKLPHSCGSGDGLQVFQDDNGNYNGFCFACSTRVDHPYGDGPPPEKKLVKKTKEEIDSEIEEIFSYPEAPDIPSRKLKKEYLNYFEYRVGVSRSNGTTPEVLYAPAYSLDSGEQIGWSAKLLTTKAFWWIYNKEEVQLFGWKQAVASGGKRLYITEGREDAVALFQAMKENASPDYRKYNPAVVSLTHGISSAVKQLSKMQSLISKHFSEVVLVFDADKAGREGAEEVCKLVFPHAHVVDLPAKDANACVINGISKQLFSAVIGRANKPKNTRIVWGREIHDQAKVPPVFGVSWPWRGPTDITRGLRTKETIYIGAAPKMGKSELVDAIASHLIVEHKWPVLAAKPEQQNNMTYKRMAGKVVGKVFHDPKVEFDGEAYERAGLFLKDNLAMLNLYQHVGWDSFKLDLRAFAGEGGKAAFIDPLTNFTNGMNAADANSKLQEIGQELSAMAMDLDLLIFIMCHLRNPESGVPHERGGQILSSQFAGSRAMSRSCNYMFGLEGNKDPDLSEHERNMRDLVLIEDREFGEAGRFPLYWDRATGLFNEVKV